MVFHVLNRGVGRRMLFTKDEDFLAFERVIEESLSPARRVFWLGGFFSDLDLPINFADFISLRRLFCRIRESQAFARPLFLSAIATQ
jgi:hypothetical protein